MYNMQNYQTTSSLRVKSASYKPMLAALLCGVFAGGFTAASTGLAGCNGSQISGNGTNDGGGNGGNGDGGNGGGDGGDLGGQAGYCAGQGPPIQVTDSGGATRCSGQVAATAFRYALCVCQGLSASSSITTDAFDSSNSGASAFGTGGSVGVNGDINTGLMTVGGTLQVAKSATQTQNLVTGVDLLTGSTLSDNQNVTVGRDATINGDVKVNGTLKVTGTLTYPTGKMLTVGTSMVNKTVQQAQVTVAEPCDCAANLLFDIAGYVTKAATNNDNAAIGLNPALLNNFQTDQTLNLTCGRFYLNNINGSKKLTINVSGRTALFVGSDVNLNSDFNVVLSGNGELDLFINGGLTSSAPLHFGNKAAPARVRLYMGGSRNINLAAGSEIDGNIYAPQSALVTSGALEVFGAVFVNSFNPSNTVAIHHDIAILKAADSCTQPTGGGNPPPPASCSRCQDCGGQACKGGSCGACTSNADCCAPLSCVTTGSGNKCVYVAG